MNIERNRQIRDIRSRSKLSMAKIGSLYGLSRQRVEQILKPALHNKRRRMYRAKMRDVPPQSPCA